MSKAAGSLGRPLAGAALIVAVWGWLLPAALRCGPLARHVARLEAGSVNPAAMFYTELERIPVRPQWLDDRIVRWPQTARQPRDTAAPERGRHSSP
jgi:hypothetical protein